jgi:hypothetical protein
MRAEPGWPIAWTVMRSSFDHYLVHRQFWQEHS